MELIRLILKFVLLCQVGIQESSRKGNGKFSFLKITWESLRSWRVHFSGFKEPKIQNFHNHGDTSVIYWVYYKPAILSYFEVGTYARLFSFSDLLALFCYTQSTNTYTGIF